MTPRRLVALATLALAGRIEPCGLADAPTGPIELPRARGRHRAHPRTRPIVIGERR